MKTIPVIQNEDGSLRPSEEIRGFKYVYCDGNNYYCYEQGDAVPIVDAPKPPSPSDIAKEVLEGTDRGMARVLEDLIDVLDTKGILIRSELPLQAVKKLDERASLRTQIK